MTDGRGEEEEERRRRKDNNAFGNNMIICKKRKETKPVEKSEEKKRTGLSPSSSLPSLFGRAKKIRSPPEEMSTNRGF
uniref:Uncharacterized protein n=1 Tax=Oryza punctata TaxID=4537 RepID=A0A0E0LYV3_ORYPU